MRRHLLLLSCALAACTETVDPAPEPVEGEIRARVVYLAGGAELPAAGAVARLAGGTLAARAGPDGRLVLRNVPAGSHSLRFEHTVGGSALALILPVELPRSSGSTPGSRDLGTVTLASLARISGTVRRDGAPVASAHVVAQGVLAVRTDAEGAYELGLPRGTFDLVAVYADADVTRVSTKAGVVVNGDATVNFDTSATDAADGALSGRVVRAHASAPTAVTIELHGSSDGEPARAQVQADGSWNEAVLPVGIYSLVARAEGARPAVLSPVAAYPGAVAPSAYLLDAASADCDGDGAADGPDADDDEDGTPDANEAAACVCAPSGSVDADADGLCDADEPPITIVPNPAPSLARVEPASLAAGSESRVLSLVGTGFVAGSVARWDGADRATTFVSGERLDVLLLDEDVASEATVALTVFNPAPGGGTSAPFAFEITAAVPSDNPVPVVAELSPASLEIGATNRMVTVIGSGFTLESIVRWNAQARTTTFVTATELRGELTSADVLLAGSGEISVVTPAPGGGTSNAATLSIVPPPAPTPVLAAISPDAFTAGSSAIRIEASGSGFTERSVIRWGSQDLATWFLGEALLAAELGAAELATAGSVSVTVHTPAPGGGSSDPKTAIISPPPAIRGVTTPILVNAEGTPASTGTFGDMTPDGRYVTFDARPDTLVAGDSNATDDVFVRDTCRGAPAGCTPSTSLASLATDGSQSPLYSHAPRISANGRYVLFESPSTTFAAGDTNGADDLFLRDTCLGATGCTPSTIRASVGPSGGHDTSGFWHDEASLSADGRYIQWLTSAAVVPGDTNSSADVYVRDLCTGVAECVPRTILATPYPGSQHLTRGYASANGRFLLIRTRRPFLPGDTNDMDDLYLRSADCFDCTPSLELVSRSSDGAVPGLAVHGVAHLVTDDGRYVFFSDSADLTADSSASPFMQIFRRDTCRGAAAGCVPSTVLLSDATTPGNEMDLHSELVDVTPDGRHVAFVSISTQLEGGDGSTVLLYLRDTCLGATGCTPSTRLLSRSTSGTPANDHVTAGRITADAKWFCLQTAASNILGIGGRSYSGILCGPTGL